MKEIHIGEKKGNNEVEEIQINALVDIKEEIGKMGSIGFLISFCWFNFNF